MINRDLMVGPDDGALQETPNVLDGVGMNLASDIFADAVVDRLMASIMVGDAPIRPPIVGVDRLSFGGSSLTDKLVEG